MAETTIEWTRGPNGEQGFTFNPWEGCNGISPACDNCYAEARNKRFNGGVAINWGPHAPRRRTSPANWAKPLKWNTDAAAKGTRYRVFCASLADVFDNQVPPEWRADLFKLILATPHLDWLLLTKRIGNAFQMMVSAGGFYEPSPGAYAPQPNIWLGATIANQTEADRDIPKLLAVPARVRFLSMEPLLGPVDLRHLRTQEAAEKWGEDWHFDALTGRFCHGEPEELEAGSPTLHWVITGGESGHGARPSHPEWFRILRDQCAGAGVPFFFKQWGDWLPGNHFTPELSAHDPDPDASRFRSATLWDEWGWLFNQDPIEHGDETSFQVGKKAAGRLLDGRTWDGFPS